MDVWVLEKANNITCKREAVCCLLTNGRHPCTLALVAFMEAEECTFHPHTFLFVETCGTLALQIIVGYRKLMRKLAFHH